ncbi:pantoate--beta-alanine ligase [Daejeonella oryzae]|uniref:pantoate--beta-alanine ligase n=1 Tax=Daejeonella oryzae TaxID=1122943 RepID=UPI00042379CB|nr:pantoate--beta-alanine ligase [Daejeonella oryzae]
MKIFHTRSGLSTYLNSKKTSNFSVGLVPTMGALHNGHLSLIEIAANQTDLVVCSIFVNPTQFTDSKDLDNYPRPIENDIAKLEAAHCDVLFLPSVSEMYHKTEQWHIDLGDLDKRLEGKIRPGHYQGVTQIVNKLFTTVNPDKAFFGQKDYQQFLVIKKMVDQLKLDVELIMCPIIREQDGLAMSSRNIHLSPKEHADALILNQVLKFLEENFKTQNLINLEKEATKILESSEGIELEYLEICNADNLEPVNSEDYPSLVALVAAKVGRTRLIDNTILR